MFCRRVEFGLEQRMPKRRLFSPARCCSRGCHRRGNLVARTVDGNLVLIHPDGTQEQISSEAGSSAVISPDHRAFALTVVHVQKVQGPEFCRVDTKLLVMTLSTHVTTELVHPRRHRLWSGRMGSGRKRDRL
jgi:hypothetical protein